MARRSVLLTLGTLILVAAVAGAVLAGLDPAELERSLAKAHLDLEKARADMARAGQEHQDALDRARLQLRAARSDRLQAGEGRQAALDKAKAEVEVARLQLEKARLQDQSPRQVEARIGLEKAQIARQEAQAAYDAVAWRSDVGATRQALALQRATLDFEEAQAVTARTEQESTAQGYELGILQRRVALAEMALKQLQGSTGDPPRDRAVEMAELELAALERGVDPRLRLAVASAQLEVEQIEARMSQTLIAAPFDGVVLDVQARPGTVVGPGSPVVALADLSRVEVWATAIEENLPRLRPGLPARLFFDALPEAELPGHLSRIIPRRVPGSDRPLYEVVVALDEPVGVSTGNPGLYPGMTSDVSIIVDCRQGVLTLPRALVRTRADGTARVRVLRPDGSVEDRTVQVGLRGDVLAEIVSGLDEGERVVSQ